MLKEFCIGLATVCLNAVTFENEFSRLRLEKNEHCKSLTNFFLKDALCSKQYTEF